MRLIDLRWTRAVLGLGLGLLLSRADFIRESQGRGEQPPASQAAPTTRPARAETWLRVTGDQVQVRSRPDANSLPVTRMEQGDLLRAVDQDQYGWYRVLPPEGVFSYVSAEHVDRHAPTEGIVSVRSGTLRVRVGSVIQDVDPLQSEVQILLERGTPVEIVGEQGGWLKIVPPPGVYLYVAGQHVEPVSDEVAARLRSGKGPTSRAAATSAPAALAAAAATATQPVAEPNLSGPWGQRLVLVEATIQTENRKPLLEQTWTEPIARLRPIAVQAEDPAVARLAQAWITQLEQRIVEQGAVHDADEVLRRSAREQSQQQRELERLEQARQRAATRPAFAARGELLRSYAVEPAGNQRWYKLRDPLTLRIEAYVEIGADSKLRPDDYLGQYVGIRGSRRAAPGLGADVVRAEEIVALTREEGPATRPARQAP